jgi:uncharacterized protein YndB with AHSA1/START domain
MRLSCSLDIRSDPATVFSWLADPEKARVWMTSVASTEILERKAGMVGTTFRERVEGDGDGVDMQGSVTAFEPDRCISFHLESRVNALDVVYRLERSGDATRLTMASDIRWLFPVNLVSLFAGRAMKRKIAAQSSEELARLKELCEAPNACSATIDQAPAAPGHSGGQ